jgi:hypothetical protein
MELEQLAFRTKGMFDTFFREFFINGLKDEIRAQVLMNHPQTWLEATQCAKESQHVFSNNTNLLSLYGFALALPPLIPLLSRSKN